MIQHVIVPYLVHVSGVQEKPLTPATVWARKGDQGYEPYSVLIVAVPTSLLADQLETDVITALQSLIGPDDLDAMRAVHDRYHRAIRGSTEPTALGPMSSLRTPVKYAIAKQLSLAQEVPGRVLVVSHASLVRLPLGLPGLSNAMLLVDEVLDSKEGIDLNLKGADVMEGVTLRRPLKSFASLVSESSKTKATRSECASLARAAESIARVHRLGERPSPPVAAYYVAALQGTAVVPKLKDVAKHLAQQPRSVLLLGVTADVEASLQLHQCAKRRPLSKVLRLHAQGHLEDTVVPDVRIHTPPIRLFSGYGKVVVMSAWARSTSLLQGLSSYQVRVVPTAQMPSQRRRYKELLRRLRDVTIYPMRQSDDRSPRYSELPTSTASVTGLVTSDAWASKFLDHLKRARSSFDDTYTDEESVTGRSQLVDAWERYLGAAPPEWGKASATFAGMLARDAVLRATPKDLVAEAKELMQDQKGSLVKAPVYWYLTRILEAKRTLGLTDRSLLIVNSGDKYLRLLDRVRLHLTGKGAWTFELIPPKAHGLNSFSWSSSCAFLAALNPDPKEMFFYHYLLGQCYSRAHERFTLSTGQGVARTALRDTDATGDVAIFVPDTSTAEALTELFVSRPSIDYRFAVKDTQHTSVPQVCRALRSILGPEAPRTVTTPTKTKRPSGRKSDTSYVNEATPIFQAKGCTIDPAWSLAKKQVIMCSAVLPLEQQTFNRMYHQHRKQPTDQSRNELKAFRRSMIDKLNTLIDSPSSLLRALAAKA